MKKKYIFKKSCSSIQYCIFLDINDPVILSNLPLSSAITVFENTALSSTVFTASYSDIDVTQSHVFTMTSSPSSGLTYFTIDSTSK